MKTLQALLALNRRGIDHVADAAGHSADELIAWGAATRDAEILHRLAGIYFNSKARPAAGCVTLARKHGLSLIELEDIETFAGKTRSKKDAWQLRRILITTPSEHREEVAKQLLAELYPPKPRQKTASITRRKDKDWTISFTSSSRRISAIWDSLKKKTFDAFEEAFFSGNAKPAYIPHVVIPLGDLTAIVDGEGDDIIVQMTNGATMTGAEFMEVTLADHGFASLVDPEEGPINLYRLSRFANFKQRTLLAAEHIRCVWPDCNTPASECQFHHIKAWKHGGETNLSNLVPLCPYHNGVNNDEKTSDGRGFITKHKRRVIWHPPDTS